MMKQFKDSNPENRNQEKKKSEINIKEELNNNKVDDTIKSILLDKFNKTNADNSHLEAIHESPFEIQYSEQNESDWSTKLEKKILTAVEEKDRNENKESEGSEEKNFNRVKRKKINFNKKSTNIQKKLKLTTKFGRTLLKKNNNDADNGPTPEDWEVQADSTILNPPTQKERKPTVPDIITSKKKDKENERTNFIQKMVLLNNSVIMHESDIHGDNNGDIEEESENDEVEKVEEVKAELQIKKPAAAVSAVNMRLNSEEEEEVAKEKRYELNRVRELSILQQIDVRDNKTDGKSDEDVNVNGVETGIDNNKQNEKIFIDDSNELDSQTEITFYGSEPSVKKSKL